MSLCASLCDKQQDSPKLGVVPAVHMSQKALADPVVGEEEAAALCPTLPLPPLRQGKILTHVVAGEPGEVLKDADTEQEQDYEQLEEQQRAEQQEELQEELRRAERRELV